MFYFFQILFPYNWQFLCSCTMQSSLNYYFRKKYGEVRYKDKQSDDSWSNFIKYLLEECIQTGFASDVKSKNNNNRLTFMKLENNNKEILILDQSLYLNNWHFCWVCICLFVQTLISMVSLPDPHVLYMVGKVIFL